ncbi:DUF6062 family protein [Spirochaeta cellobiosiphila]|uniref:DUF6062 family protein n=1 Tax=Spirochaeta cellobiosiphila TaxID=504483 RepID=UPI0004007E72|nr:DUF6062 family protein [Spirochaeta cellobiosiphila]
MKYELETIPVWDAVRQNDECPFCILNKKAEEDYVKFYLGDSVMVPEIRLEVNKHGFCYDHYNIMLDGGNRHGLGLMLHTHYSEYNDKLSKNEKKLEQVLKTYNKKNLVPEIGKNKVLLGQINSFLESIQTSKDECLICDKMEGRLKRYYYTFIILWQKNDQGFRQTIQSQKGFCDRHFIDLISLASNILKTKDMILFLRDIMTIQKTNRDRIESEILWYTQKFDPQYIDKPWGTAKDAVYRTIQRLVGLFRREE